MRCIMMNIFIVLFFKGMYGQEDPSTVFYEDENKIKIFEKKVADGVELFGSNLEEVTYELILNIKAINIGENYTSISRNIPPMDTLLFIKLSINDKKLPWSYNTSYNYKSNPTENEKIARSIQLKEELIEHLGVEQSGQIALFYKNGCSRSEYTKNFLERKKIPFKIFNTSENEHFSKIMWKFLKLEDSNLKRIRFLVLLMDEEIIYNMENLSYQLNKRFKKNKKKYESNIYFNTNDNL